VARPYDRLKRFDLADRAYARHPHPRATPGDPQQPGFLLYVARRLLAAHAKLREALAKDPTNRYIQNNIEILEKPCARRGRKKV